MENQSFSRHFFKSYKNVPYILSGKNGTFRMPKMAQNSEEVIFEGWLTKSPPTKRIWRARWRRRWFLLTHTGELPGQYILTYYTDRNRRKLKGVINLDHCEQVDLGLKLEERNLKFDHVFDIKTPNRTYYLAADTEDEMKSWVNCICKVCGLKSTNDEEDVCESMNLPSDVEVTEENLVQETPPITPVSTGPYIPISECFTGRSPVYDPKDFKLIYEENKKNLRLQTQMQTNNKIYNLVERNYMNLGVNEGQNTDPRFYDCPRQLEPPKSMQAQPQVRRELSPLRSPTDSDSVFNDEESWVQSDLDTSKKSRPSDSSDIEMIVTQKFTKSVTDAPVPHFPPPRPPKPAHITPPPPSYFNLPSTTSFENSSENEADNPQKDQSQQLVTDDMYDFPRSHNIENNEQAKGQQPTKHYYNNAAPSKCPDGTIFRYDISPKPSTSTAGPVFRYDLEATQALEPSSPAHSHSSSTHAYSNLPSPLDTPSMPPPTVNRELKPSRKLSDAHSVSSNNEPPSPRSAAPSVDRKLKPPTQEVLTRKSYHQAAEEDGVLRRIRAAPSPTPPAFAASQEELYQNQAEAYHYVSGKMQYLDLDLDGASSSNSSKSLPRPIESDTVYKKVDFIKTEAFNITRTNLEKQRQEPAPTFSKK